MHTDLIKETIQLDKQAREKVEMLRKEKETLEKRIQMDEQALIEKHKRELETLIEKTRQNYESEILLKKETEKAKFDHMCEEIKHSFEEKESEWVESIYAYCIE
ncbi:MAG: hypothetical protein RBQ91_02075 [Acholeplasma sp.]|nr:hypothetical protein [Acholeplasma sp.]